MVRQVLTLVLVAAGLAACGGDGSEDAGPANGPSNPGSTQAMRIEVLSNRADLVSGGDALVEIIPPKDSSAAGLQVNDDGRDVSEQFSMRADGRIIGLVTGLDEGANVLIARLPDGRSARITITNHPQGGPVFAGGQVQPWPCLAGAADAQCNRPPRYEYFYLPVGVAKLSGLGALQSISDAAEAAGLPPIHLFQRYDLLIPPPVALIQQITTDHGVTVPYIVRQEIGTQDRGQYRIAVLFNPEQPWEPWAPQAAWNGKTYITGGSGCGTHHGELAAPGVLDDNALARGYAVISTSLNHATRNCNIVVQAEALMMLKEHFTETYGPIRYTIGSGASGGAIYQQQVANAYPGIFDGILPGASFPDMWSVMMEVQDCALLLNYWKDPARLTSWTPVQQAAVAGHPSAYICHAWVTVQGFDSAFSPQPDPRTTDTQSCNLEDSQAYNAQSNPTGVRCALQDYMASILGRRPQDGFANRPWDNVGVQYGLQALREGTITPAQFVDLNSAIGGIDIDRNFVAQRSEADRAALVTAYRGGLVNQMDQMARIPIIDLRGHNFVEIHHDYRSYQARARLDRSLGQHDNQVIWTGPVPLLGDFDFPLLALDVMSDWLDALTADDGARPLSEKVLVHKPAYARDRCWNGLGQPIDDPALCALLTSYDGEPRSVAGAPPTGDILKCTLKPPNRADYAPVVFTDEQWASLEAAFPTGVCDYDRPGVEQQPTVPWQSYAAGPGGQPLGQPPTSIPFGP